MVAVMMVGIGVVVFVLWVFVFRGGYADFEEFPDTVEHAHLRQVAEARLAELSRGAIVLARKERGVPSGGSEAAGEFWRRFATLSVLVESDPVAAVRELREVSGLLHEALREVGTAPAWGRTWS